MNKKTNAVISEIWTELENISSYEEKIEKVYIELTENKSLSDVDKKEFFDYIKEATKRHETEVNLGAWCFLGDCYYHGIGCKKSITDAIEAYNNVIDKQGSYVERWRSWAGSKLGNIYLDKKNIKEAKKYIHMSTCPEDYERLSSYLWKEHDEKAALEDLKKAGDYGRTNSYKIAIKKCLSSSDTGIKERAVEFAKDYFNSDAEKKDKQKVADKVMDYFYDVLRESEIEEREHIKSQIERFKSLLGDNNLKIKSENKIKKFLEKHGEFLAMMGIKGLASVVRKR